MQHISETVAYKDKKPWMWIQAWRVFYQWLNLESVTAWKEILSPSQWTVTKHAFWLMTVNIKISAEQQNSLFLHNLWRTWQRTERSTRMLRLPLAGNKVKKFEKHWSKSRIKFVSCLIDIFFHFSGTLTSSCICSLLLSRRTQLCFHNTMNYNSNREVILRHKHAWNWWQSQTWDALQASRTGMFKRRTRTDDVVKYIFITKKTTQVCLKYVHKT